MKREKLIKRRRSQFEHGAMRRRQQFVYRPRSAHVLRKELINELKDWPVEKLSPYRQHVELIHFYTADDDDAASSICAVAFLTKRGTVTLTGDSKTFRGLHQLLCSEFGEAVVPKKERHREDT
jgi:hypothetical protein